MSIIDLPTEGTTPSTPTAGGSSDILMFFRELRAFLEIPVVQDLIRQRSGLTKGNPEDPMKLTKHDSSSQKMKKATTPTPEEIVIEQLMTAEGRKSLADGIKNIIGITGDIKLSEVIKALTEEDKKK